MDCPVCEVELKIADRQGIEIDYCAKCRGVWLDRGELDKIIERSSEAMGSSGEFRQEVRPTFREDRSSHYGHHKHYKRRKRRSLLSELLDF